MRGEYGASCEGLLVNTVTALRGAWQAMAATARLVRSDALYAGINGRTIKAGWHSPATDVNVPLCVNGADVAHVIASKDLDTLCGVLLDNEYDCVNELVAICSPKIVDPAAYLYLIYRVTKSHETFFASIRILELCCDSCARWEGTPMRRSSQLGPPLQSPSLSEGARGIALDLCGRVYWYELAILVAALSAVSSRR